MSRKKRSGRSREATQNAVADVQAKFVKVFAPFAKEDLQRLEPPPGRAFSQKVAELDTGEYTYTLTRTKNSLCEELTHQERVVVRLVVGGNPYKTVARELEVEVGTVHAHVGKIKSKLKVHSRAELVGLIMPPQVFLPASLLG